MSRFFFLLREALVNLKRNFLVVAGAVLAVFISLSLAFGALVVNEILRLNTLAWQEGYMSSRLLQDEGSNGVPPGAHQALLDEVETWEEVNGASTWTRRRRGSNTRRSSRGRMSYSRSIPRSCQPRSE